MRTDNAERMSTARTLAARVPLWTRYLLVGVIMGLVWGLQTGPLWEHAVRLAVLLMIVPPLLHQIRTRRDTRRGRRAGPHLSLVRISAAKAGLVAAATLVTWLVEPAVKHPEYVGAFLLTATIAGLGPLLHARMVTHPRCHGTTPQSQYEDSKTIRI